ncbi:hypothetical protein [Brevundimonas intermedia]|uniref:hypothetical protein n=1 Tax=Brevundimonas intermedia TaxID=74315 RepID=UPI00320AD09B
MFRAAMFTGALLGFSMHAGNASAQDGASFGVHIRATVPLFCRVRATFDSIPITAFVAGDLDLGAVDEVCNNGSGYKVSAQFLNVSSGALNVDGVSNLIVSGETSYSHPTAAKRTRFWRLSNMSLSQPEQPVRIRVSISPI